MALTIFDIHFKALNIRLDNLEQKFFNDMGHIIEYDWIFGLAQLCSVHLQKVAVNHVWK